MALRRKQLFCAFCLLCLNISALAEEQKDEIRKTLQLKFVYKTNEHFSVRVAKGGPELQFDAFNGSIYVKK